MPLEVTANGENYKKAKTRKLEREKYTTEMLHLQVNVDDIITKTDRKNKTETGKINEITRMLFILNHKPQVFMQHYDMQDVVCKIFTPSENNYFT